VKTKPNPAVAEKVAVSEMPPPAVRLMSKHEVCAIVGVSYPSLWTWMRNGSFPRSVIVGGQSKWRSSDIDAWMAQLPVRPLKGDPVEVANVETVA
jgi:predicted DNA-binding transcriptional regulator AlpA